MNTHFTSSAVLNALVLVGGKSRRMGIDKSTLIYHHDQPQWQHIVSMLEPLVSKVYVSVRKQQEIDYPNIIVDKIPDLGPFGAIYTAMDMYPSEAFLVLAVDIPFIDQDSIQRLILARDITKDATAYKGKTKDYPEPLVCIWEPSAFSTLQSFYEKKIFRPIQVLKQSAVKTILIPDSKLQNINTLQEYRDIKKSKQE